MEGVQLSQNLQLNKQTITFPNGNQASVVTVPLGTSAEAIIAALEVTLPKALIVLAGGADKLDDAVKPKVLQLLCRGVARAALSTNAVIIDGGTKAGVMELIGEAVSSYDEKVILLGIVPSANAIYPSGPTPTGQNPAELDPYHTHFVLVQCDQWGCETKTMFTLAKLLGKNVPAVTVVVDGGEGAKEEVRMSVRNKWPIIVVEKSGRIADEIAVAWKQKGKPGAQPISDAALAEIVADGNVSLFSLDDDVDKFRELIGNNLCISTDDCLREAWGTFSYHDENAKRRGKTFHQLQKSILLLGIMASALALVFTQIKPFLLVDPTVATPTYNLAGETLKTVIIILPILISALVAGSNRFKAGNKWVLLRSSAESIKSEIYAYRTGTNNYRRTADKSPEIELQKNLQTYNRRLMQTEVNRCGLSPYTGDIPPPMDGAAKGKDNGLSRLTPEQYIEIRIGDQLGFYKKKTVKLEQTLQRLQWSIYGLGGLGTFLAAVGLELWIALTTTIVGVITVHLEYQQVENTLIQYNQTASDLDSLRKWWFSLSAIQKENPKNYDKLVELTETALRNEMMGWTQRMENALARLHEEQEQIQKKDKTPEHPEALQASGSSKGSTAPPTPKITSQTHPTQPSPNPDQNASLNNQEQPKTEDKSDKSINLQNKEKPENSDVSPSSTQTGE